MVKRVIGMICGCQVFICLAREIVHLGPFPFASLKKRGGGVLTVLYAAFSSSERKCFAWSADGQLHSIPFQFLPFLSLSLLLMKEKPVDHWLRGFLLMRPLKLRKDR